MATTLVYGATTIVLSDDLLWIDEFDWTPVEQTREYSLGGALIVDSAAKLAGRPITLVSGSDFGWLPRSTIEALRVAASLPAQQFTLTHLGVAHTVIFDGSGPLTAEPVWTVSDPDADDPYVVSLRFLKV